MARAPVYLQEACHDNIASWRRELWKINQLTACPDTEPMRMVTKGPQAHLLPMLFT